MNALSTTLWDLIILIEIRRSMSMSESSTAIFGQQMTTNISVFIKMLRFHSLIYFSMSWQREYSLDFAEVHSMRVSYNIKLDPVLLFP